jgi:hypothetical protein
VTGLPSRPGHGHPHTGPAGPGAYTRVRRAEYLSLITLRFARGLRKPRQATAAASSTAAVIHQAQPYALWAVAREGVLRAGQGEVQHGGPPNRMQPIDMRIPGRTLPDPVQRRVDHGHRVVLGPPGQQRQPTSSPGPAGP